MSCPALTYVDSTILIALVSSGPTGDAVRRWFRLTPDAWISSEIALTRAIQTLPSAPIRRPAGSHPHPDQSMGLLSTLHAGVAIRPLPLRLLSLAPLPQRRSAGAAPALTTTDALELAVARLWRCRCLISNRAALRQAAEAVGLSSLGIRAPAAGAATVGDWPGRSPIPP